MQRQHREDEIARLYSQHYSGLVRLATLMLRDVGSAEEVVQDAFVSTHAAWWRLHAEDRALPYLRRTVVNGAHSAQRHRRVRERHDHADPVVAAPSAESESLATLARRDLLDAVAELPRRQREVLFLRYYLDLSEADIAETLGLSKGSVKTHASRALVALRQHLEVLVP